MLLFFLRHGDPVYDPDSLTPLGKRQAEALARRLSRYGLDRIFCSSSERAKQTAQPTCELLHQKLEILDWSNESYAWQALASADPAGNMRWMFQQDELRRRFASEEVRSKGSLWYTLSPFDKMGLEATMKAYDARIDMLFQSLGYVHDRSSHTFSASRENDQRVAFFAHAGFGMVFLSSVLDIPYPEICTHFSFGHSGMTVIDFQNKQGEVIPQVLQLSNDSHLYADGLPTKYNNLIQI